MGERKLNSEELIKVSIEKIQIAKERLKVTQDRQKSYADTRRKDLEFEVNVIVFLKVAPWKGVILFQKKKEAQSEVYRSV